ncbi:hypothetical protein [Nonomuraea jabiensis]|uniref:hypothetical protein n=1 Tax=Nonomuraea jabiensis TaxID=882448 RepID=UPI0036C4D285
MRAVVAELPGVDAVLDRAEQAAYGIDHARAGDPAAPRAARLRAAGALLRRRPACATR